MKLKITTFYCLRDDFLIFERWRDEHGAALTASPAIMKKAANFLKSMISARLAFKKPVHTPPDRNPGRNFLCLPDHMPTSTLFIIFLFLFIKKKSLAGIENIAPMTLKMRLSGHAFI